MAAELKVNTIDIAAYLGSTMHPIFYLPDYAGAIRVLDVQVTGYAAGTSIGLLVVTATDVGTPVVAGTVATFAGTVVYAEGVVFEATVGTPVVQPGQWICVKQTSGTAPANTLLNISYVLGQ